MSAFQRLIAKPGGFPLDVARLLRSLFERRNIADYGPLDADEKASSAAISDATVFVDAVEAWLSEAR